MVEFAKSNYEDIVPARAEIQSILDTVKPVRDNDKSKAKGRNDKRKELLVKELEKRKLPKEFREKILSDLNSYPGWENVGS